MTPQKLFNIVSAHLLKQNSKSISSQTEVGDFVDVCAYRGNGGKKCAIGCLIPDDKYSLELEGKNCFVGEVRLASGLTDDTINLAGSLQAVHDLRDVVNWRDELNDVANRYHLKGVS